ncbi:Protein ecm33 [Golovinomyces cichoracearum]|uniref:Protein ecm33 n=1 Tax=Golovinomyces cichoracearum TaxID=62708 RepID=A0A420IND6_9PEZI|nr:Protein ecm33 [Golovinomyces cichoracearum]
MLAQVIIPLVATMIGIASGQISSACSQNTVTINSQADVSAISSCSTINGNIVIGPSASGVISIDGPQQLMGNLICEDAGGLTSLGSMTIGSIGGTFGLKNLTLLSTLSMGSLKSASTINWVALPALSQLNFPATITKAKSVTISNTFLSTLDGINLETVQTLQIDNNNRLKTFSTQIANVTSSLNINSNGNNLDVSFPNLVRAANMTFRNVSTISIPSLATVEGSLGFYGNYMPSISAPNITSVGSKADGQGSLALVANSKMSNISMPLLKTVGGAVQIANNSALTGISFPALTYVGGAIDFSGNFSTPELPALENVKGGFNMQSTTNIDCSEFDTEHGAGKVIQGVYVCKTTSDAASMGSGTNGSGSSKKSDANTKKIGGAAATVVVFAALVQALL